MEVIIVKDSSAAAELTADIVGGMLAAKPEAVLGLATGSTPIKLYERLVERHKAGKIGFGGVTTFNLDEYLGVEPESPLAYRRFMNEHLFQHIDIDPARAHFPECAPGADPRRVGPEYEALINTRGGIDLQILGIGANGHIGFNEPGSSLASRTRVKTLTRRTLEDNSRLVKEGQSQPATAITMGIGSIMEARRIILLATGEQKARAVALAVEGAVSARHPASILQMHRHVRVIVDEDAASGLAQSEYYRWVREREESIIAEHGGRVEDDPWFHPSVDEPAR